MHEITQRLAYLFGLAGESREPLDSEGGEPLVPAKDSGDFMGLLRNAIMSNDRTAKKRLILSVDAELSRPLKAAKPH